MAQNTHDRVLQALTDRDTWEQKQRLWYQMRHLGLPRRNKPFPNAADLHLPIGDNAVEKQKPFYVNSVFSRQQLASFTPLDADLQEAAASAAECLDWKIRNESNYEEEFHYLLDPMLVCGRAILKVRWDSSEKRLEYESIDPLYFIVPKGAHRLDKAPFVVHVKILDLIDYQMAQGEDGQPIYRQDQEYIDRIRGGQDVADRQGKEQEKASREGITYTKDPDTIILFELWERCKEGWRVSTYSPTCPNETARPDFLCPYRMQGKPFLPFVAWAWEVTEKGWYAPRGIVEKVAPYETYGTKCWNGKADFLEYGMRPLFTTTQGYEIQNTASITIKPGSFLPPGTSPVTMPAPPVELDGEINSVRELAEESVQSPDFGVHKESGGTDSRTATEMSYIQSFASQGVQYRGQIIGRSEGDVYAMSWALLVQFAGQDLVWFAGQDRKALPEQARKANFLIRPDSKPDAWNRTLRMQRAVARKQMFTGDPNIDQMELSRSVLEEDDPRLVDKLLIGQGAKQAAEAEDEAKDILLLEAMWPAQSIAVNPAEDHALRLRVLFGRLDFLNKIGKPVNPFVARNLQQHVAMHLEFLKKQNPALAKQFTQAIAAVDAGGGLGGAPAAAPVLAPMAGPGPETESATMPGAPAPAPGAPQEALAI